MKKRRNKFSSQQIISIIFGVVLISIFIISLVLIPGADTTDPVSDISLTNPANLATSAPTPFPFPTLEPDGPVLVAAEPAVSNYGLFQITVPDDYTEQNNQYDFNLGQAKITFLSPLDRRLSVIDVLLNTGINFPSHQALADDYFTQDYFNQEWSAYEGFTETSRTIGDTITIDFDLQSSGRTFLGRQIAWLDNDWLHVVRLIVPSNNPALLQALTDSIIPTFISYSDQRGYPYTWQALVDPELNHLIRHPGWRQTGAASLESFAFPATVVIRSLPETPLTSIQEAEAFLSGTLRAGADTLSVQTVEREFGGGYVVSFTDVDRQGNPLSGLAALLNDAEGNLYIAELRLREPGIDLLALDAGSPYPELRDVIGTFMLLPPEDYTIEPVANPPAMPELTPDATDEVEMVDPLATEEALETLPLEETVEPEATPTEASVEDLPTLEVTLEATDEVSE